MYSRLTCLPALALLAASAAAAPEAKDDGRIHALPGGVTDAARARGFVANATGGVDALDLETGKVLWTSKDASKPLAVVGDHLLARDAAGGNVIRIVYIDLADGKKVKESDPIVFPAWVTAVEGNGGGRSFHSSARLDKGDLLIPWQANTSYWGGRAPTPEMLKAATHNGSGAARIDVESGKVEMLDKDPGPPPSTPVSKLLEKAVAVGDFAVAVETETAGDKIQKVVLKRWDLKTEKPLDPVTLAEGGVYQAAAVPAAAVVLIRRTDPRPVSEEPTWDAYSLETGKPAGKFLYESGTEDITVVGPRAYYVVKGALKGPPFGAVLPRTLKAVDVKTGKRLWETALEGERLPPPPPP
jgi:outer membrane protein assembly factor BamB